jgi:hypothetical protein
MFMVAGGLAAVVGVGALLGWGVTRMTATRQIPVIEADSRPVKIRPDDRGGLRVPNQDEIIFERRTGGAGFDRSGRLAPAAEAPNLDALRAATAPPPAPRVTEAAPEAVPPATSPAFQAPQPAPAPLSVPAAPQGTLPAAVTVPAAPAGPAPVVAPAVPAPPAPRIAPGGSVAVQLGALDSEAGARTEWDRLARRAPELLNGRGPQIMRFDRPDKPTMWRLRTGGFSPEAARDFCAEVRAKGGACAVIGG